ncbi:hypothetical protein GCM10022380_57010 [Amycolatopsis tucumanensis]|uniref:Uncharacterized protein n=1 Tax=Amycolatopsis tucumanensis TaxID=401106 RepID=A0ABP7IZM0_9PSEU
MNSGFGGSRSVAAPGEATGSRRTVGASESTGSRRAAGAAETTGSRRAVGAAESTGSRRSLGASESTGSRRAEGAAESTGSRRAVGASETTGSRRAVGASESTGSRRAVGAAESTGSRRAVGASETTGSRRAVRASESTGSRRAVGTSETTGSRRAISASETTGSRRAISASETTGSRRAISATETTGSRRAISASETTGSRRVVGESSGYRRAGEGTSTRILAVDGRPQLGRRRAGAGESTGSHRVAPGEATGSHRVLGEAKRGIAKWPIVAGVFVVLLVLGILGWGWADSIVANRAEAQASACAEGDSNLSVVAAPSVAPAVTAAAERWNQAKTVVHAHCVHVQVQAIDDQRVLLALTGRGNLDSIGGQPAVWIPETSATITELTTARPTLLTSPAEPLAANAPADYPCAVLTAEDVDEVQQRASQRFRNYLQEPAQQADFTRLLHPGA